MNHLVACFYYTHLLVTTTRPKAVTMKCISQNHPTETHQPWRVVMKQATVNSHLMGLYVKEDVCTVQTKMGNNMVMTEVASVVTGTHLYRATSLKYVA